MIDYIEFLSPEGACYIRRDAIKQLAEADVAVFDCDGVLLDVRESYRGAAAETASVLLEALTDAAVDPAVFDDEVFFAFKKTGGFNNDWSVTYAYVIGSLGTLPDSELAALAASASMVPDGKPAERLRRLVEARKPSKLRQDLIKGSLLQLAAAAKSVDAVDARLLPRVGESIKRLLRYRGAVGDSVVSTLFEEIFAGSELFEETFGIPAAFNPRRSGFIEKEKTVLTEATLKRLDALLGGRRLGVASGSMRNSACHALGSALDSVPRLAQVWHEDVEAASTGVSLHKPNGYPLIRAASPYSPYRRVIYVGDTMADLLTARNADRETPGFSFLGVYKSVDPMEATRTMFLESGADAVAPTVNQLPLIIEKARRETR